MDNNISVWNENENERPHRKNERTFAGSEKSEVDLLTTADDATPLTTSDGDEGAKADAPETRRATVTIEMMIIVEEGLRVEGSRLGWMSHILKIGDK